MKEFKGNTGNWRRGQLLITRITANWDEESRERSNKMERSFIFSNFHHLDKGKSRKRVCIVDVSHPDYEANANLIAAAPELLIALRDCVDALKVIASYGAITPFIERGEKAINKALGL